MFLGAARSHAHLGRPSWLAGRVRLRTHSHTHAQSPSRSLLLLRAGRLHVSCPTVSLCAGNSAPERLRQAPSFTRQVEDLSRLTESIKQHLG
jgi:hypothetical protein